jgi:gamma-glutamyltranspeptidase/glutathione hydrolase
MMAPTLVFLDDGRTVVTGSGGSNRIRSAILQVVSNLVDFAMPLQQAVAHPRIHFENDLLSLEPDLSVHVLKALEDEFPLQQHWDKQNLFFGGAHTVMTTPQSGLVGTGDVRRGGVAIVS